MTRPMCVCGWHRASDLETCGHYACEAHALGWGALILRRDDGDGWRHYLNGEPVHCGSGLLLAHAGVDVPKLVPLQFMPVRYESPLATMPEGKEPPALLYLDVHGHEALIRAHSGMRFRWPHRSRS